MQDFLTNNIIIYNPNLKKINLNSIIQELWKFKKIKHVDFTNKKNLFKNNIKFEKEIKTIKDLRQKYEDNNLNNNIYYNVYLYNKTFDNYTNPIFPNINYNLLKTIINIDYKINIIHIITKKELLYKYNYDTIIDYSKNIINIDNLLKIKENKKFNILYLKNYNKKYYSLYKHVYRIKKNVNDVFDKIDVIEYLIKDNLNERYYKINYEVYNKIIQQYIDIYKQLEIKYNTYEMYNFKEINYKKPLNYIYKNLFNEELIPIYNNISDIISIESMEKQCKKIINLLNILRIDNFMFNEIKYHKFEKITK